jgi:hypothetical protein
MVAFVVDDLRLTGFSIENAWALARHILSRLQYLGIHDAPRKRRCPLRRDRGLGLEQSSGFLPIRFQCS